MKLISLDKITISDVEEEDDNLIETEDGIESVIDKYDRRENTKNLSELVKLNEFLDKFACNTKRFLKYYESQELGFKYCL